MFADNEKFRNEVMDELIKDCIHMEVAGIVSGTLAVSKLIPLSPKVLFLYLQGVWVPFFTF